MVDVIDGSRVMVVAAFGLAAGSFRSWLSMASNGLYCSSEVGSFRGIFVANDLVEFCGDLGTTYIASCAAGSFISEILVHRVEKCSLELLIFTVILSGCGVIGSSANLRHGNLVFARGCLAVP